MASVVRFTGGRIWTGSRTVESLLVAQGRVITAGTDAETRASSPTGTEVEPLEGRLVIPGLIDPHVHLAALTRAREGLSVQGVRSLPELLERIETWGREHPGAPILGRGWSVEQFAEAREPTGRDLDRARVDQPVVLEHASGHAAVLNRIAFEAVGYGPGSADPEGGRLGRQADGAPDGRVYEAALAPVGRWIEASGPVSAAAVARTQAAANAFGLTTVATLNTDPDELAALRSIAEAPSPTLRVRCYLRATRLEEFGPADWSAGGRDGWLSVPGLKAVVDGAFGPRTAWLREPYADDPNEFGVAEARAGRLVDWFTRCAEDGLQPAVHAIGDRALDEVLTALASMGHRAPARPRIEHASLVPPDALRLLAQLHPTVVVQPGFVWSDGWLADRIGPDRVRWAYPFRSLAHAGVDLAGSTDAPYDPPDPWRGLASAVRRVSPEGRSANPAPEEALSPEAALDLFTRAGGRALREPDLGFLEPPARADLVVTDAPDLAGAIRIGAATVRETWVAGRRVYARAAGSTP